MDCTGTIPTQHAQWRLMNNERWSNVVIEPRDIDPREWYRAFETLMASCWGTPEEAPVQDPVSPSSLYNLLAELGSDDEEDQGRWRSSMGGCSREARVKVRPPPNAVWDPSLLVERHEFICNLGVFFGFPFRYQRWHMGTLSYWGECMLLEDKPLVSPSAPVA